MKEAAKTLEAALERVPGAKVIAQAVAKSGQDHAKDMAASIAYFSFFSLFPLLVGLVAAASSFVQPAELESRLDRMLSGEFPGSADFVRATVAALIDHRGAAGVASVVALLWSASKMFGAISRGINLAFGTAKSDPFYVSRLRYFGMTIAVSLLLLVAVATSTSVEVLARLDFPQLGRGGGIFTELGARLASFLFIAAVVSLLYKIVPQRRPRWRELVPGALLAALLFNFGKMLFALYLEHVANLEAVYGSLTSVIVLLLWLYFSARVLLLGKISLNFRSTS